MYTLSNAYVSKFSSGTILALLAISGLLVLIPIATPVLAANASAGSASSNVTVFGSAAAVGGVKFSFSNPASNQFSQNQFEAIFPNSGWTASGCTGVGLSGIIFTYALGSVLATTFTLPPGSTGSITCTVTPPALVSSTSAPDTGTNTYKTSDTSSGALITASTQTVYVTGATGFSDVTSPAATGALTAGTSVVITFTATGSTKGIAGIPVTFSWSSTDGTYDNSGLATLTASSSTDSSGNAVATFFPDPVIADQVAGATVTAKAGGNSGITGTTGAVIVTKAAAATTISIAIGGITPPAKITKSALAPIAAGTIVVSSTDAYTNPAVVSTVSATSVTLTAVNLVGSRAGFSAGAYTGAYPYVPAGVTQTSSASIAASATSGNAALPYIYDVDYLAESYIVASANGLSPGTSSHIITYTLSAAAGTFTTPTGCPCNVAAGKSQSISFKLPTAQANVPVYFLVAPAAYAGGFPTALQTQALTDNTGTATVSLKVSTDAGDIAVVTPKYAASPTLNNSAVEPTTGNIVTIAGAPSKYTVLVSYDPAGISDVSVTGQAVNGTKLYIDIAITDAYANLAVNPGPGQIQITLSTTAGGGALSATAVYISPGLSDTFTSFGVIYWVMPATIGTSITLSASGVSLTTGTFVLKTVSATPQFTVTSPKPLSGVIYSGSLAVVLNGYANVSKGFATNGANLVTMATLGYKVGSGTWKSISLAGSNPVWSFAATMSAGLNTLSVNVTDSNGDVSAVQSFTVLVDTAAPVVTFTTANGATINFTNSVTATIVVAQGDLNATSVVASVNGTALASSAVTVSGTNNNGHSVTYTVTLKGLPAGHDVLGLSAKSLAGLTGTASSITVKVQVSFAQSVIINSASYGTLGSFNGVSVSATNIWSSSQSLVVFAVWKNSAGQTVAVTTGGLTLASGQTGSTFCPLPGGLPSGSYSVSVFVITTSNNPVSSPTSITVSV